MKIVTRYQTEDGQIFENEEKALKHEQVLNDCKSTLSLLPDAEAYGTNYLNGGGDFQLTPDQHIAFKTAVRDLIRKYGDENVLHHFDAHNFSVVGRILSDGWAIYAPFTRLLCIDANLKLWGQPYYAANPSEGKQVCLNVESKE